MEQSTYTTALPDDRLMGWIFMESWVPELQKIFTMLLMSISVPQIYIILVTSSAVLIASDVLASKINNSASSTKNIVKKNDLNSQIKSLPRWKKTEY